MPEFLTIRNFTQEAQYIELLHLLESHDIPYQTEEYRQRIDPISMVTLAPEYIVKVQPHDFAKVSELMNELAALAVLEASEEHYLFDFKDEELFENRTIQKFLIVQKEGNREVKRKLEL